MTRRVYLNSRIELSMVLYSCSNKLFLPQTNPKENDLSLVVFASRQISSNRLFILLFSHLIVASGRVSGFVFSSSILKLAKVEDLNKSFSSLSLWENISMVMFSSELYGGVHLFSQTGKYVQRYENTRCAKHQLWQKNGLRGGPEPSAKSRKNRQGNC